MPWTLTYLNDIIMKCSGSYTGHTQS